MKKRNIFILSSVVIVGLFVLFSMGQLAENVDAEEIVVIQFINGEFNVQTSPGVTTQWFGKVTRYPKVSEYAYSKKIRFNDGGGAEMHGTVNWKMPLGEKAIIQLHMDYGSAIGVAEGLVMPVVNRSIYMTGPLMSSKESYAEKRPELLEYVADQINNGVYKTISTEVKTIDPLTGADKTVTVVEIQYDDKGLAKRQEEALLSQYSVSTFNFSIDRIPYDSKVEEQIQAQQQRIMDVQTAIAEAKKAEQATLTVIEQGKANAAKAKWAQEEKKATAVTEAEQKLAVASLDAKSAEQEKRANILRGEGEAQRKKLVMTADGALEQKLAARIQMNKDTWQAIADYKGQWVPSVVMGENGSKGGNGANDLINLLNVKTAKELSLNMAITKK